MARAPWGLQARSLFEGARDVVLPSPSGLARLGFDEKLAYYRILRELVAELPGGAGPAA